MAGEWSAPSVGTPCWINVFATDVPRAKQFYATLFNWNFDQERSPDVEGEYAAENFAFFQTPDRKSCPGGGITKVAKEDFVKTGGKGGVALYLAVDGLEGWDKKVEKAGGKVLSEIKPEGNVGWLQHFEDTEGNFLGLWTMKKTK